MKRLLYIFLICWFVLFSFGQAYPQFNLYVQDHLLFYQANDPTLDNAMVSVNLELNSADPQDFHNDMNDIFTDENVYFSRYFSDENNGGARKTQLYLSDLAAKKVVSIIGSEWANTINQNQDNVNQHHLPMIFPTEKLDVDGVSNDDEVGGFFLFGCQCENLDDRLEYGFSKLSADYDFNYQIQYSANALNFDYAYTFAPNLKLVIFVAFVVWACFLFTLISRRKEIGLLKLEGISNTRIFFKYSQAPFLLVLLISFLISLLIGALLLRQYPSLIAVFSLFCVIQLASMGLLSQLLLLTLLFLIRTIQGVSSIKGQSSANAILSLSMTFKLILIIILMPQVAPMGRAVIESIRYTSNYVANKDLYTDLYMFNEGIPSNLTYEMIGSKPLLAINDIFKQNNDLFTYSPGMFPLDGSMNNVLYAVRVDQGYIEQFLDYQNLYDPSQPLIIFPTGYPYKEKMTELIWEEMQFNNPQLIQTDLQVIEIDLDDFKSYDLYDILTDVNVNQPLYMYSYPPELQGQLNFMYLTIEPTIISPQEYVDEVFASQGFSPLFRLSPVKEQLTDLYESYMNIALQTIFQTGAFFFALIILVIISTITIRYLQSNEITVWSFEGLLYKIKYRYFLYLLLPTIIGFGICTIFGLFSSVKSAILTLLIVVFLEVIVYECSFRWRNRYGN